MPHDPRLIKDESKIEQLRGSIPTWIKHLERPKTPCIAPAFGPLEGIRDAEIDQMYADGIVHRTDPFTEPQVAPANP